LKNIIISLLLISCGPNITPSPLIKTNIVSTELPPPIIWRKDTSCPVNMIHVQGKYCDKLEHKCIKWLDKKRCKEFAHESNCSSKEKQLDFCMDENEAADNNSMPLTNISFDQAEKMCKSWDKRICNESEFVKACQGEENYPYPYGFERIAGKCNIDHKAYVKNNKLVNESVSINNYPNCKSSYGVHNLIGNVDEWTRSDGSTQYESVLHGGYWNYVRGRCDKSARTTEHYRFYSGVQTGFRCCKDVK